MGDPRSYASITSEEFLAAILGKPAPVVSDSEFLAIILGEQNFNPDEPRDERGRWTTGGTDDRTSRTKYNKVMPGQVGKDTLLRDKHTVTILVGHAYSVRDILKSYTRDGTPPPPKSAIVAAIACQADQPGIHDAIGKLGLLPPSWEWPKKPVEVPDGINQLVNGVGDLLQEASNQWGNDPDFKGVNVQIVADPTAANELGKYDGSGKLPPQFGDVTPGNLVSKALENNKLPELPLIV